MEQTTTASPGARRIAIAATVLILGGIGAFLALRMGDVQKRRKKEDEHRVASATADAQAITVEVVKPTAAEWRPSVDITGNLEPIQFAELGFEMGGRIARVGVELGDRVEAGQVLAVLDRRAVGAQSAQSSAAIALAEAQVEMANDRLGRVRSLAASGAVTDAERVATEQGLELARAQLNQARAAKQAVSTATEGHLIRAPFAGIVTRVPVGTSGIIGPGMPVMRIEDLSSMRLRGTAAEEDLDLLKVGAQAQIAGSTVVGTLTHMVRSLDPMTRRAPVEVLVANSDGQLVGNALARATVLAGDPAPALRVPGASVRPDGSVLVVKDGRVAIMRVTAHPVADGTSLVIEGLDAGALVIRRPSAQYTLGLAVRPLEIAETADLAAPGAGTPPGTAPGTPQ